MVNQMISLAYHKMLFSKYDNFSLPIHIEVESFQEVIKGVFAPVYADHVLHDVGMKLFIHL
jgi:hypothetical protein